jgi:hypothetical protein
MRQFEGSARDGVLGHHLFESPVIPPSVNGSLVELTRPRAIKVLLVLVLNLNEDVNLRHVTVQLMKFKGAIASFTRADHKTSQPRA